ncbi:MAG TPA: nucleotide exchange factor GrpE, partial [bacterium]|nr:nucleotide exchange factor GrpE [bacterium]
EQIKKMWKEKEESASEKIILKILPAIDNFERALKYSKDSKNFEAILKGVEMVYKFLMQTLEDEGLKPFDSIGKKFDPKIHEAVETVNKEDLPDEVIVEEFQRGYFFKGKLLRPAKVVVNKRR